MSATSNGPTALPALPPSWKNDCAKPLRPAADTIARRDDSGWKIEEPMPIIATAKRIATKPGARESITTPVKVSAIPTGSDHGLGLRSVTEPTTGCNNEAVI